MMEKPNASTTIGLELEGKILKIVQLSHVKNQPRLDTTFEISVDLEHSLFSNSPWQDIEKSLQKALVVTALDTQDVLIRQLEIKLKKDKDIEEVLLFQTEPLLPYPSDQAVLDFIKIGFTDEGTLLTVLAARKDHLQQHLQQWSKLHIEPEITTAVPAALTAFSVACVVSDQPYCIVHLGLERSTCVLVQEGQLIAAQSIPQGINNLKQALVSEDEAPPGFGDIDISQITEQSHPGLYQAWEAMRLNIKRVVFSFSKQVKGSSVQDLLITGAGALVPHLASTLVQNLDMRQIFPEKEIFSNLTRGQLQSYAVPIGAALSGLPFTKSKVNFRQGDLVYPHPWKRFKFPLLIYAGLCLAVACAFYLFGQSYLAYRQDQIKQAYIELLSAMNKPYESFEKDFELKNPHSLVVPGQLTSIQELDEAGLVNRVQDLEKELHAIPDLFPLLPNVPKVSDVLAWLSTQHVLIGKKGKGEFKAQPIQIENFSYDYVKRPEQTKKQEKYQVKVEIEFTSQTPKQAREFHDALIEPNDFVDPKGEVKWNSSHGRYRTSFYLKDKTIYPS